MTRNIVIALGLSFVLVQLSLLSFTIPITSYSYGTIGERIEKVSQVISRYTEIAARAMKLNTEHRSIVFVGDILLARNVEKIMAEKGESFPFLGLPLRSLGAEPAIVGNFESSMVNPHITTPALQMRFSVDKEYLGGLTSAGFTHLSLANNHSFDYGEDAYDNARTSLTERGFEVFGHGREVNESSISYIETTDGTIALIGIHASASEPDYAELKTVLEEAAERSYLQIAYIHWGNEYILVHSKTQERIAENLIDLGVDLIVGHHPHVVQDIDLIDGVVVFYSLGNYVFDQYFSEDVKEGLVVALDISDEPMLNLFPVTSEFSLSQPKMMDPTSHQEFLISLAERSDERLREAIIAGVVPLGGAVATSTEMAIMMR